MSRGVRKVDKMVCHSPALASSEGQLGGWPCGLSSGEFTHWVLLFCLPWSKFPSYSINSPHFQVLPLPRMPQGLDSQLGTVTPGLVSLAYFSWGPCAFCSVFPWVASSRWWSRCSALAVGLVGEMVPRVLPTQGRGHFH